MREVRVRRVAALALAPLLLLATACSAEDEAEPTNYRTIGAVEVTGGFADAPEVDFPKPFNVKETESKVLEEGPGTGNVVEATSSVSVRLVAYVGRDGSPVGDKDNEIRPWTAGDKAYAFPVGSAINALEMGLEGRQAGDVVLITAAPKDAYGASGNGSTVAPGDSIVLVVALLEVKTIEPTSVIPKSLPVVQTNAKDLPTAFEPTATTPQKVTDLGIYLLKTGKGAKVTADQTLSVNYLGQIYPDGKVFDESYSKGQPASFALNQVIPGWTQGLVGLPVGSRVVLVIPPDLGYGNQDKEGIPPGSTLIFVIDIISSA